MAANFVATLPHPDREASVWTVAFSPDGKRLFTAGYPSGVVQVFDVATREEVRRIATPAGYRGSADYALLTDDWKTLYVPVETRTVSKTEKDGKAKTAISYAGAVRVWDVATGTERPALASPAGSAPGHARFGPGQRSLVVEEVLDYVAGPQGGGRRAVEWDLAAGRRRVLPAGGENTYLSPDGRTALTTDADYEAKAFTVRLTDAATGAELARLPGPADGRMTSVGGFAPDGSVVAVSLGGTLGGPVEVWFRDGKTLADRGRYTSPGDPARYSWAAVTFLPGGRCAVAGGNKLTVWDIAAGKAVQTLDGVGVNRLAVSPDGMTLAVGWAPKYPPDLPRDPAPEDLPQPRVTLLDPTGAKPPRTLLAPAGFVGGVAVSPDGRTAALGGAGGTHLFDLTR